MLQTVVKDEQKPFTVRSMRAMAARIVAAAQCSQKQCSEISQMKPNQSSNIVYNREDLFHFGRTCQIPITSAFQHSHGIPPGIARTPASPWIDTPSGIPRRRRRERKQKRGCRSGDLARLKRAPDHHCPVFTSQMSGL